MKGIAVCEPRKSVKLNVVKKYIVKSKIDITARLELNGYKLEDKRFTHSYLTSFNQKMFDYCGKEAGGPWSWMLDWLDETEVFE
jgi:hypothetical protein